MYFKILIHPFWRQRAHVSLITGKLTQKDVVKNVIVNTIRYGKSCVVTKIIYWANKLS